MANTKPWPVHKEAFDALLKKPRRKPGTEHMIETTTKSGQRRLVSPSTRPFREPFQYRPTSLPEGWQDTFLEELRMQPIPARASRIAGISRRTAFKYKEVDPEFCAAWEDAIAEGKEKILEALHEQVAAGVTLAIVTLMHSYGFGTRGNSKDTKSGDTKVTVGWED